MTNKTVLLVEDEENIIFIIREILALHGVEVLSCDTGEEAMKLAAQFPVDLIISDINLPDMDGQDLYTGITRQMPQYRKKFLFMSGFHLDGELKSFIKQTRSHFIQKPFHIKEFQGLIENLLKQ